MKEKEQINIIQEENKADLKSDLNNLRLTCPECDLIPALFFDIKSRNIYQISAACENKHTITNTPVKQFYEKYMKIKQSSSDSMKDFICSKHNANYNSFCKSCQKNICKECTDTEHKNHFITQYFELLPTNEEIIQLKNSIETETNEIEEFLTKTYNKWLEEINQKFNALIESIRYKNKLYNFIINFYESKEFNYQNIYNIKIVSQNQQKRNPLTQEMQTLKNLISQNSNTSNESIEKKNSFLKLKTMQIIKVLNLLDSDINSNYKFVSFNESKNEQSLESFLDDKKDTTVNELNKYAIINPYNKTKTQNTSDDLSKKKSLSKSGTDDKESKKLEEKMQLANEVKLKKKKLGQIIPQESIVYCMTLLKDNEGNNTNKFATGLDNGNINVYYFDKKTNKIYLDFEIKEHTKAVTFITGLKGGRILSCSYDNTMKLIEETLAYSYLLSFWKRYYVIQTFTKPDSNQFKIFQPICAVEMNVHTIVSGDYTHLTLWRLIKKSEKKHKKKIKNFAFDLIDYNKNKYDYYYEIYREISISSSATSLLNLDNKTLISAHYGPSIVTFYNIYEETSKTLDKIRCVDSANQCMTLIEMQKNYTKEKIVVIGGYKCIYLLSVKTQSLIDKIMIQGNDYVKCIINSGINYPSNGFICAGLFNQFSYDLVHFNTKSQLGFNELTVDPISKITQISKSAINSILFLKKDNKDESCNQKNVVLITAGNDQNVVTYMEKEGDDEEDEDDEDEDIDDVEVIEKKNII